MTIIDAVFYVFAFVTVVSAAVVVFSRNIIYSAFALLFTFFGVAGLYALLGADFLAVTQLLIYVGGILVLLLFGVMLTTNVISVDIKTGTLQTGPSAVVISLMAGSLCGLITITDWNAVPHEHVMSTTVKTLGEMFLTSYVLPFEVASVVLLVALLGAAIIARKEKRGF